MNTLHTSNGPTDDQPVGQGQTDGKKPVVSITRTRIKNKTSLYAHGEPMIWFTGGALVLAVSMIVALVSWIVYQGSMTFWPLPIIEVQMVNGKVLMGEVTRDETFKPGPAYLEALKKNYPEAYERINAETTANEGYATRRLIRVGNFEITGGRFDWVVDAEVKPGSESSPPWALVFERQSYGRFYGNPVSFTIDGQVVATEPEKVVETFNEHFNTVSYRWNKKHNLETHEVGKTNRIQEQARLALRAVELKSGTDSEAYLKQKAITDKIEETQKVEFEKIRLEIATINAENAKYVINVKTAQGVDKAIPLDEIVRMYPANQLSYFDKLSIYVSRWWELFSAPPREANTEGGVFPAIFGTVVMTLLMSVLVVPFGVLAALYLREYAKAGPIVSAVRIAINNLAGVPSIVFGVFGLGFFCYIFGASIDQLFFSAKLPTPTYGTGGVLWASFTLALLTLPVVIVATEEALAAVPSSMREGSYACGASKWQTIRRIVLPRAMPGIMTGMILAMARGAGEVAPLMLVGAVKLAPELVADTVFPFIHPERSFMHLGFHIYDLGFQSPDSEAAKPMVYTATLLLIGIIATLNITAIIIRNQLRKKFVSQKF